jgi:hypothetical protein
LHPRIQSTKSLFRKTASRVSALRGAGHRAAASTTAGLARKPSRLTVGLAAAGVATVIGVTAGVAAGATGGHETAVNNLGAGSHSISLSAPHRGGAPAFGGGTGSAAGHTSAFRPAAHPAATQTVAAQHAAVQPAKPAPAPRPSTAKTTTKSAAKLSAPAAKTTAAAHPAHATAPAKPAAKARPAAAKKPAAPARPAAAKKPAAPARPAAPKPPGRPYLIYDSVTPTAIPAHHEVATYATGGYAVSPTQVAGRRHVLWIDTTGSDYMANALDVEPGDATPQMAANWAYHRLAQDPKRIAVIYTMQSEWPACQQAVASLSAKMRYHIRWWIADPTGVPHILPGASATQWYWGQHYDITTASPNF